MKIDTITFSECSLMIVCIIYVRVVICYANSTLVWLFENLISIELEKIKVKFWIFFIY